MTANSYAAIYRVDPLPLTTPKPLSLSCLKILKYPVMMESENSSVCKVTISKRPQISRVHPFAVRKYTHYPRNVAKIMEVVVRQRLLMQPSFHRDRGSLSSKASHRVHNLLAVAFESDFSDIIMVIFSTTFPSLL